MEDGIVWCDADGNQDDNGCYDEGGHYYAERASYRNDYLRGKLKEDSYDN